PAVGGGKLGCRRPWLLASKSGFHLRRLVAVARRGRWRPHFRPQPAREDRRRASFPSPLLAMHPVAVLVAAACLLGLHAVHARPTIYMVNENDKLEPALVPVSSTVIPLPVYKVSASLGFAEKKGVKTSEPVKLITGGKKKSHQDDNIAINIKQISKEEYELQP
ncbi:Uncharacterized protein GBIM_20229, partial [Gryllus bimaculatus]